MAFYSASPSNNASSSSIPGHTQGQSQNHLPHLAPSGDIGVAQDATAPEVSLKFTEAQVEEYKEQDRYLPIANVARIMKNSLPTSAKVSKEAKECVQECVSEFISFITSEAADKCFHEKRKTIGGEDILTSMQALGFDNYAGVMKVYLSKYRVHQANLLGNQDNEDENDDETTTTGKKKKRKEKKRKRESGGDEIA